MVVSPVPQIPLSRFEEIGQIIKETGDLWNSLEHGTDVESLRPFDEAISFREAKLTSSCTRNIFTLIGSIHSNRSFS
jgi:hypothetical protein